MSEEDWDAYERLVAEEFAAIRREVGGFALSREEIYWKILLKAAMPPVENARALVLPLHIHLCRGEELGSDLKAEECSSYLAPQLNLFWSFARISFEIVKISEHEFTGHNIGDLKRQIWNLTRDPSTGKMTGKNKRREIFLHQLIGSGNMTPVSFDIWFFDFIGQQSQGCCIDRDSRTIIMGRRSTKGYTEPTCRPLACLAKTMAHELGHALSLNHPNGQRFQDGTSYLADTGKNNLMVGGTDVNGGGGELLCPWQVLIARESAIKFLASRKVKDDFEEGNENREHEKCAVTIPTRIVTQLDALEWLNTYPDGQLPGEVFTSVPDISELHELFPSPQKNNQNYKLYKDWFQQVIALILCKTPQYAIFLQTDIRALTGKDDRVLEFIDKSALIQEVAITSHFTVVWHKIVTNSENFSQKRVSHSPNWSHLICLQREGGSNYETREWKTPDVFTRGDMTWERAVGLNVAMTGVSFLKHMAVAKTVVDPFCGLGTVLAVANALGLHSVGNDLSRKRAKRSSELDLRYSLCSLSYKQRAHYGVTERLPYSKDTVPKPYMWNSPPSTFPTYASTEKDTMKEEENPKISI